MRFDCVNGFLNSIKEIIWQTEAIYRCPLMDPNLEKWELGYHCMLKIGPFSTIFIN